MIRGGAVRDIVYLILNRRGEYGRSTIITSNLPLQAIAAMLDDRIANRLARYGNVVTLAKDNVSDCTAPDQPA